jgi:hypothetical protein
MDDGQSRNNGEKCVNGRPSWLAIGSHRSPVTHYNHHTIWLPLCKCPPTAAAAAAAAAPNYNVGLSGHHPAVVVVAPRLNVSSHSLPRPAHLIARWRIENQMGQRHHISIRRPTFWLDGKRGFHVKDSPSRSSARPLLLLHTAGHWLSRRNQFISTIKRREKRTHFLLLLLLFGLISTKKNLQNVDQRKDWFFFLQIFRV